MRQFPAEPRVSLSCLVVTLLASASVAAASHTVRDGLPDPGWHLVSSSPSGLELRWQAPPLEVEVFHRDGDGYARLSMADAGKPEAWGIPEVPVFRAFIRIPSGGRVSAAASTPEPQTYGLTAFGAALLAPVSRPVPKIPGSSPDDGWVLDETAYASRTQRAGTVRVTPVGTIRGVRVAMVEFHPVCYDPAAAAIEIVESAVIRLQFEEQLDSPPARLALSDFGRHAAELVLNPPAREQMPLPAGYLIITADAFYNAILPLAEWKTLKGYPTTVTKTSQIPGGATTNNIKTYIQTAYQTWDPPPEFVLLVGDSNTIPAWNGSGYQNPPNDLYYSCVDGTDWVPDLYLGRFSLRTATDIQALVEKTVDYEQAAWGVDHLWTGKEYFVSSDDGSYHGVTEGTHTYCMAKARAHGVVCDSLWGYTGTGTPITTAINAGRAMLAYSGHGVETAWQGPSYNGWYVDQLTNLDKYPIVLSFACLTGNFTYSGADACFMERWIKPTGKGAVVAYGSSVSSFWYDDDYLQRRMWDALFDNGWNWMGGFTLEGKLRYKLHYGSGSGTRGYFEQYNILGDPSLLMYTLVPSPLAATFPATIPAGTPQSVAITVTRGGAPCQGALVCLYKAGEVHAAGYTDVAGQANLSIPSATAGTMEVTATAFNSIAFLDDITVGGGGDPEPPSMPAWSSLDAASGLLTWAPSTDNVGVTGYRVYRSTTPQFTPVPGLLFVTTPSTSTDVSSSLGDVSVNYNFRVTAVDAALNESVPSPTVGEHDFQLISPVLSRSSSAQLPVE